MASEKRIWLVLFPATSVTIALTEPEPSLDLSITAFMLFLFCAPTESLKLMPPMFEEPAYGDEEYVIAASKSVSEPLEPTSLRATLSTPDWIFGMPNSAEFMSFTFAYRVMSFCPLVTTVPFAVL